MDSVQAMAALQVDAASATPRVSVDQGATLGADFTQVLEGFRQRAAKVEDSARTMTKPTDAPATGNERAVRQLAELYTYAVDMQVLVRTSGQLTSGMRQLVTGQ